MCQLQVPYSKSVKHMVCRQDPAHRAELSCLLGYQVLPEVGRAWPRQTACCRSWGPCSPVDMMISGRRANADPSCPRPFCPLPLLQSYLLCHQPLHHPILELLPLLHAPCQIQSWCCSIRHTPVEAVLAPTWGMQWVLEMPLLPHTDASLQKTHWRLLIILIFKKIKQIPGV